MSDKISFVPDSVVEGVTNTTEATKNEFKKSFKEMLSQIFGVSKSEIQKKEDQSKKIAEKAEKSGRSVEEQAKIESLRRQLHAQVSAPTPKSPDQPVSEEDDKVGSNETLQPLGGTPNPGDSMPTLAQPSMRHGERLKIRE